MKTQFIQINDPSEINTSRATVFDLNKRYIDRTGNMYSLRYNREAKKVEVIKIMRTTARNESYFTQKMMEQQKKNQETEIPLQDEGHQDEIDSIMNEELPAGEYPAEDIDPVIFRDDLFNLMLSHKERINGIVKNIYNSKIVSRENREAVSRLDELFRNLDIDCSQRIDKIINSYREMTEYPRSLNYYIGRLDNRARAMIGDIHGEEDKLHFVILHEMHAQAKDLFSALARMLQRVNSFLDDNKELRLPKLAALEKQALRDAETSIENTLHEIRIEAEKLKKFNEYIHTMSNFRK
ncbi:MAG: hypothetical protein ACRCUT_11795 [Spirochaetota bacterium]